MSLNMLLINCNSWMGCYEKEPSVDNLSEILKEEAVKARSEENVLKL